MARVGVLASQGGFAAHMAILEELEAQAVEVRRPEDFNDLDALIVPGGESTTIMKAIARDGLEAPIAALAGSGRPVLGTCAGMIVLSRDYLGVIDINVRRNAFGRQLASFETDLLVDGLGPDPLRAIFIRAPWVEEAGTDVNVLATFDGHPVVVQEGNILACAFHPELAGEGRLHAKLIALAEEAVQTN